LYEIGSVQQKGAEGPYFNYTYSGQGFAEKEEAEKCSELFERFSKGGWIASDESEEEFEPTTPRQVDPKVAGKF
jgi:aspartyl aminopeptidase